ncbi:LolA family protein [Dactylosporangium sp. CS-047395]|uniref:LolA family protein n=1 Tax=Dactylosporangium sp. CS-047395 TaxID=3239936 RepID=UPI003D8B6509
MAAKTLAVAAEPDLPPRTAAQLLVDLQTATLDGLSGTVVERADLGLPSIPLLTGDQSAKLTSLVSGKHTLRVWYSGPDKARVSLLGTQGQSDIIHNGNDTWIWDSQAKEAQHFTGQPGKDEGDAHPTPTDLPKTPQEAADLALKTIDPTTQVSTGTSAKIAGRNAYELVLRPRDTNSLIGEVRLAIDAQEKLPLRVQVLPRGTAEPAFEVAFTSVNFARPDDAEFKFNPPAGTKVEEGKKDAKAAEEQAKQEQQKQENAADKPKTAVIGTGWTSVLVVRSSDANATKGAGSDEEKKAQDAISQLPTGNGGRTFNSKLVSVLFTDDGRVLIGSVTPERLAQVAADPAAALK